VIKSLAFNEEIVMIVADVVIVYLVDADSEQEREKE
jgi:hypothetical protein